MTFLQSTGSLWGSLQSTGQLLLQFYSLKFWLLQSTNFQKCSITVYRNRYNHPSTKEYCDPGGGALGPEKYGYVRLDRRTPYPLPFMISWKTYPLRFKGIGSLSGLEIGIFDKSKNYIFENTLLIKNLHSSSTSWMETELLAWKRDIQVPLCMVVILLTRRVLQWRVTLGRPPTLYQKGQVIRPFHRRAF